MQTSMTFWDNAAERYSKAPIRDMKSYTYTLDRTRSYLKPSDHVLELGCGTGGTARLLADSVAQITGTDISPAMIQIAQRRAEEDGTQNARFEAADIMASPQGPFDAVLAHNLFHLVPETEVAIARIGDMVKPGGLFISKTPCLADPGLGWKMRLMRMAIRPLQMLGKAPFVRMLSIAELEAMIADAGFEIVEVGNFPAASASRYIVARRKGAG